MNYITIILSSILAVLMAVYFYVPVQFPDRIAHDMSGVSSTVNNTIYDVLADEWYELDGWARGLHAIMPAKRDYYNSILSGEERIIIDVGCGAGILTEHLKKGKHTMLIGYDISEASILEARQHHIPWTQPVHYTNASIYALPLSDNSVDVVVISDILDHIIDLHGAMKEIDRVLRSGGLILFGTITRRYASYVKICLFAEMVGAIPRGTHDWRLFITPRELNKLFLQYNFTIKEVHPIDYVIHVKVHPFLVSIRDATVNKNGRIKDLYVGYAIKK